VQSDLLQLAAATAVLAALHEQQPPVAGIRFASVLAATELR
jgi:hypothetical protein